MKIDIFLCFSRRSALPPDVGIPFFLKGSQSGEMSTNAGGLIRWPVYALIPLGFHCCYCRVGRN